MKRRTNPHVIETRINNNIRKLIGDDEIGLYREITERDYGVDAILELFNDGSVTGKIAFLQIKGKKEKIERLKSEASVSCAITTSNLEYAKQINIPVILLYSSLEEVDSFYFMAIQEVMNENIMGKMKRQKSITVRIPVQNNYREKKKGFYEMIDSFYRY